MGSRVLVVLPPSAEWSRGILRGFMGAAHERDWILLYYEPPTELAWLAEQWHPDAVVLGPGQSGPGARVLKRSRIVSVNEDATAAGIASVCLDEEKIAEIACAHLLSRGLRHLSVFRYNAARFARRRDRRFCECAVASGAHVAPGWWIDSPDQPHASELPSAMCDWLRDLPKPCGVFACCDSWARIVGRYCRVSGIRIPDEIALVGADNDAFECELNAPPITSVAIPWEAVGEQAAFLVQRALAGESIAAERIVVPPGDVVPRRSSDLLAIEDPLVEQAVVWIREHADSRITVPEVTSAVATTRQRLERRFRAVLGRTVMQEVRRAHIEIARRLLSTTELDLAQVARLSGFTTASLLSIAFHREMGMPPGVYRRSLKGLL